MGKVKKDGLWWGLFRLEPFTAIHIQVGSLTFVAQRLPGEWRFGRTVLHATVPGHPVSTTCSNEIEELGMCDVVEHFASADNDLELCVVPVLADRPVVSRLEQPFHVPPGHRSTLYVSSPLWFRVAQSSLGLTLVEFPLLRPSDTWFGPTNHDGELCYASREVCRVRLDDVNSGPHCALTAVTFENKASTSLRLDQIKLPAPYLALFHAPNGQLWTQDVAIVRSDDQDDDFAALKLRRQKPESIPEASRLAEPRRQIDKNPVMRAFSALFD